METVLIFARGGVPGIDVIDDLPVPDLIVAADGGYDSALQLGYSVHVLVGDLDSLSQTELPPGLEVERHRPDKDATDLELALELVVRDAPDRIIVVGGGAGRLDHELATAALLCSERWSQVDEVDWVSIRGWAHVVRRRRIIHGDVGATVTLLAMGGDALEVRTSGLKWDLAGETLLHGWTRGVSNVFRAPVAEIVVGEGCLLAVLPAA